MNYAEICIIKRDGKREDFSISKIKNAIGKAFHASGIDNEDKLIAEITMRVISNFVSPTNSVEEIQDLVEKELMKVRPEVAKKYIIYREWRNTERDRKTQMKHILDGIVAIDKNDVNLSNANMSSHTPAGQMMTFASEVTKDYTYKYLLPKKYAEAHQLGDIHIHDLDYFPTKTTTCILYDHAAFGRSVCSIIDGTEHDLISPSRMHGVQVVDESFHGLMCIFACHGVCFLFNFLESLCSGFFSLYFYIKLG